MLKSLPPEALFRSCDASLLDFGSTAELPDTCGAVPQQRASDAIGFAIGIRQPGHNLFVMGEPGSGRHALARSLVEAKAAGEAQPSDWCYVNNFAESGKPRALSLPSGRGVALRQDMRRLGKELVPALSAALESAEVRTQIEALQEQEKEREESALRSLGQASADHGVALLRTPEGLMFVPARDGEPLEPEVLAKLKEDEKASFARLAEDYHAQLHKLLRDFPLWRREMLGRVKQVGRDAVTLAIGHLIDELKQRYTDLPKVLEFLDEVMRDVIERGDELTSSGAGEPGEYGSAPPGAAQRYKVNLLVDHAGVRAAPVVFEDSPTYQNLIGRFDQVAHMGTLVTNFTLIRAGALHSANGGYLLLDAMKVLSQPFAWEGLKLALKRGRIRIETLGQASGWASAMAIEPEPIPLSVKVVLFGERLLYYLLRAYDPEFSQLFKVVADLDDELARDAAGVRDYVGFIATFARENALRPLERNAVARVVEQAARLAGDAEKLSALTQPIRDLLQEADYWAGRAGHERILRDDVVTALRRQIERAGRLRGTLQEMILRDTVLIATDGQEIGQTNGLAVIDLVGFMFAHPVRITATARVGEGEVIDIERESELGGAIHSKGVMILSAFLATRYSRFLPLSLAASLVFEQSYGPVEGDSASLAELCALLSALAGVPIKQSLAVTGSVNQHGQVQAIGAVNEKIEGFFDVCRARGPGKEQGVIIPAANAKNLMLREDVVAAVAAEQFRIYAVDSVDQAIELLTGIAVGEPNASGEVPPGSINYLVASQLAELSVLRQEYGSHAGTRRRHKHGRND